LATAFVSPTFTLTELREVFEAVWQVRLDGASCRRKLAADHGWLLPTGCSGFRGRQAGLMVQPTVHFVPNQDGITPRRRVVGRGRGGR
jgi:hypothetical protein